MAICNFAEIAHQVPHVCNSKRRSGISPRQRALGAARRSDWRQRGTETMMMPTPSLRRESPGHACDMVKQFDGLCLAYHVQPNPNSSMALDDICADIDRSKKWAYACNLVPIYDSKGKHINGAKAPPFPWEQLPTAVIKTGKKQWSRASIEAWKLRLYARAEESGDFPNFSSMTYQENRHD